MVQSMIGSFVVVVILGGMILTLCFISLVVLNKNRRTKKYREPDISLPPYHDIHLQHRDTHRTERWLH